MVPSRGYTVGLLYGRYVGLHHAAMPHNAHDPFAGNYWRLYVQRQPQRGLAVCGQLTERCIPGLRLRREFGLARDYEVCIHSLWRSLEGLRNEPIEPLEYERGIKHAIRTNPVKPSLFV